ncbi:hypothetical protein [Methanoplanus endosymbiosus]|uniref:Uncharacterized protein n=1 Tax=Methanoplanus endosymbiosus TaxID=33865 RepID=A0A9E7PS47_9EURY|nr:hypothetical protein [Methanoplanus endosymbiosus]UUX92647.1 hypothetical protein L6E24_00530 [Methanoplanus endosymbiosus]
MPFHEIELIKKCEEEALNLISEAKKEAEASLSEAEARGREIIRAETERAGEECRQLSASSLEITAQKREKILNEAEIRAETLKKNCAERHEQAVAYIVNTVTGEIHADSGTDVQAYNSGP